MGISLEGSEGTSLNKNPKHNTQLSMKNLVLFLALSLVLCFVQNTQAIPQQYADESLYQHLDDASYGENGYYSSSDLNAEHRQAFEEEDVGFFESATKSLERTWTDMSSFFWSKLDEGMATIRGFVEQPQAVSRQALGLFSFLPSINEVQQRPIVAIDVSINKQPAGRILFELFDETTPRTAENFRALCLGLPGYGYIGSKFHRIIPGFMIQGGDFERGDGTGGYSIYRDEESGQFADENFTVPHNSSGLLSMANAGPNTNGAQFFVTVNKTPWLDGKHVVFGRVYDLNSYDVVKTIEGYGNADTGTPVAEITITNCEQLR